MKKEFNLIEIRTIIGLGSIFFLRMIGVFMLIPVLANYGIFLNSSNKLLIGIAIGIYGLFQAVFQIPFGLMSDYFGRKPIIIIGLTLLAIGSVISANSTSIWELILGRALQGSGAITSTAMALLSDLIREKNRSKAMAIIGVIFSISFAISIIISPIITNNFGLNFLFWIIFIFSILGIIITLFILPNNKDKIPIKNFIFLRKNFLEILLNKQLLKINFCIMMLHIILMINFSSLPFLFEKYGYSKSIHWKIYFFTILISFLITIIFLNIFHKKNNFNIKTPLIICILFILMSENIFFIGSFINNFWILFVGLQIFFFSFNVIETLLPCLVSKECKQSSRGTAMGIYSSVQFLGIAIGGGIGGFFYSINNSFIFVFNIAFSILWLFIGMKIKKSTSHS